MVVPVFITCVRIKEIECTFSFRRFGVNKVHFQPCFIQNWEEIESLKNERIPGMVLEKSWNYVLSFLYEPCAYAYGTVTLLCMFKCYKNTYLYNKGHTVLSWSLQEIKGLDCKDANLSLSNAFFSIFDFDNL